MADESLSAVGFLHPVLPSPPPSSVADSSIAPSSLPRPRSHPLRFGSNKETAFINFMDKRIASAQGRFAKRQSSLDPQAIVDERVVAAAGKMPGYQNFKEAGGDIEKLVEVVWISGTPSLQIPNLLNLALLTVTFIPVFSPPSPRTMFRLLAKLDAAFASLLQGHDVESGEPLPGFESRRNIVSGTEKVRIKSLIEKTRVVVTEKMGESGAVDEEEMDMDGLDDEYGMDVARVYDRTMVELGDEIGATSSLVNGINH